MISISHYLNSNTEIGKNIKSRLITYPIGALCTFLNFYTIGKYYSPQQFNFALQFWMFLGIIPIFEYSLGIQVLNQFAVEGNINKSWRRLAESLRNYTIIGLPVTFITVTSIYVLPWKITSSYLPMSSAEFKQILSIFLIAAYLSGFSQIIIRVYLGLQQSVLTQYLQLAGMIFSTSLLIFVTLLGGNFNISIYALLITTIFPGFLGLLFYNKCFHRSLFRDFSKFCRYIKIRKFESLDDAKTNRGLTLVFFLMSLFYAATILIPRIFASFQSATQLSAYLLVLTSINVVYSVISSISPSLWIEGLQKEISKTFIHNRIRTMAIILFACLPFYLVINFIVFSTYLNINTFESNLIPIVLGYLVLASYAFHIVSSNLLSKNIFQTRLLLMLFLQTLVTILGLALGFFEGSIITGIGFILLVHLGLATLPTIYWLLKQDSEI